MSAMKEFLDTSYLFGGNAPFIEDLYETYLENPEGVPDRWREYFDKMQLLPAASGVAGVRDVAHAPVVDSFAQRARSGVAHAAPLVAGFDRKLQPQPRVIHLAGR